jgi:hypothetical protein
MSPQFKFSTMEKTESLDAETYFDELGPAHGG